jgi:hypothetical protein
MRFTQIKDITVTDKMQSNNHKSESLTHKDQTNHESNVSINDISTQGNFLLKIIYFLIFFLTENKPIYIITDGSKSKVNSKQDSEKELLTILQKENEANVSCGKSDSENKALKSEAKISKENNKLQNKASLFVLDESIISDFKNNMNNENLSSISKYLKRVSVKYNENIFYDKNFNPENNQINIINENIEDLKDINKEIKEMLDKVMEYKAKAYLNFKANKINEAMRDYSNVSFLINLI